MSAWPPRSHGLEPHPGILWGRLDNGLRYALLPHSTPAARISLRLLVQAGSLMEEEDQRGLAHFVEHMAFQGSTSLEPGAFVQHLERLGMAFGTDTNAHTDFDRTVYQLEVPGNDPLLIELNLAMLREIADRLLLDPERLDAERGVLLSELRMRGTAAARAKITELELLLPGSRLARRFPLGLEEVVRNAPRQRLVDFYRDYYTPGRCVVIAVGDFRPLALETLIERHFASFEAADGERPDPDPGPFEPPRELVGQVLRDPDLAAGVSLFTVDTELGGGTDLLDKTLDTKRRDAHRALLVANRVLNQRLARLAQESDASFDGGHARANELFGRLRLGSINLSCAPAAWPEALAAAERELRRALEDGFTNAEITEQRLAARSALERRAQASRTSPSSRWADRLVHKIAAGIPFAHPLETLDDDRRHFQGLTPKEAHDAFRRLWQSAGPVLLVTGDLGEEARPRRLRAVWRTSRDHPLEEMRPVPRPPLARYTIGQRTPILSRRDIADLGLSQLTFGNGVRVNLLPTRHAADAAWIGVRFGGGLLDDDGALPGLRELAESVFLPGGLRICSAVELGRVLVGHPIDLRFAVGDDAFTFVGRSSRADLLVHLQLMTGYLLVPGFRAEARQRFVHSLARRAGGEQSVAEVVSGPINALLHGDDPRFRPLDPELAAQRTVDEVRDWLRPALRDSYLEISLLGDLPPDTLHHLSSTFGSLPPRMHEKPSYTAARRIAFPEDRRLRDFTYRASQGQTYVVLYWPTTDRGHRHDSLRLNVVAEILRNRLRDQLRNSLGVTYTPEAGHVPSETFPNFGLFFAGCDTAPGRGEDLLEEIRRVTREMTEDGITHDELHRAVQPLLQRGEALMRSNQGLLTLFVMPCQEQPERLDWMRDWLVAGRAIGLDDINQVARRYLAGIAPLPVLIRPQ